MKNPRLLTTAAVALLVYGALSVLGSSYVDPVYTIESVVVLPVGPDQGWTALTDFGTYSEWNPYVTQAKGDFKPGASLTFTVVDDNFAEPLDLRSTFGEITPPEHFYWTGVLGIRGLHDTKHGFSLHPQGDGTTQLRHYEEFRGVLPMLLPDREERVAKTRASFARMNHALRDRLAR